MKYRDKVIETLTLSTLVVISLINSSDGLDSRHKDQEQDIRHIDLEESDLLGGDVQGELQGDVQGPSSRVKRDAALRDVEEKVVSSVFPLNNSHLHLMVHWAGKESNVVFCLARDQVGSSSLNIERVPFETFLDISRDIFH